MLQAHEAAFSPTDHNELLDTCFFGHSNHLHTESWLQPSPFSTHQKPCCKTMKWNHFWSQVPSLILHLLNTAWERALFISAYCLILLISIKSFTGHYLPWEMNSMLVRRLEQHNTKVQRGFSSHSQFAPTNFWRAKSSYSR